MPFLIDGHNVIAALPDIDLADDNDEAQLVIKLRAWTSRIRRKAIVIFDGGITGGPSSDLSSPDVHVVFAARFHTNADRIIHERLKSLSDASNWTVISSDHEVLDQARLVGAKVMTAQRFSEQLNQPLIPEQEKPEYVSPAAVNAWLELFPEPESTVESPPSELSFKPQNKSAEQPKRVHPPVQKIWEQQSREREMRSIGEQLGREVHPLPKPDAKPALPEKPSEISSEEVDEWLQVFHDPVESHVPKPKIVKKRTKPQRPKLPVIRKTGELTQDEVSAWLDVFPEPESEPVQAEQSTPAPAKRRYRQRNLSKKLAQHKAKLADGEDKNSSSLSEDDLALWQRMYGSKE